MGGRPEIRLRRGLRRAFALGAACALLGGVGLADTVAMGPSGSGTWHEGSLKIPLYRGGVVPFELTVIATPNNCSTNVTTQITWSESENWVKVTLTGKGALQPYPTVTRTEGVDWIPNAFFPDSKDVINGRYQFWIISAGPLTTFYYDGTTLDLLGSELDFEAQPSGSIPVQFPTLRAVGSQMFEPAANGDVSFTWNFPYNSLTRGDLPQYGHHIVTFIPPNLCQANPFRFDLSTARPYISKPLPASQALPFSEYLRAGLIFDLTVEPPTYVVDPPRTNLTATYSGATNIGGAIPKGWTMDIDAAFMNNGPPIRPWPGAGSCANYYNPLHTKGLNFCPSP